MTNKNIIKKIKIMISAFGPGIFLIGYNIGTGSITTMAKSGAEYGMTLFWALVLSVIFTYVLMVAYGQVTLVTGRTALNNIKHHWKFGKFLALYILAALVIGELLALIGITGIITDLVQEGLRIVGAGAASTFWITIVIVFFIYALLWNGQYKYFEKVLIVFVFIMALSFILVFFLLKPKISVLLEGLVPQIPDTPGSMQIIAAMAGTTCSAAVFIMRSTVVAEKGWSIADIKKEKKDALVSVSMMLFLSGIIMAVSAGTLHIMGFKLTNTIEMINLFEPIGGKPAAFILILGITGAGISTIFPIVLIAPWLISDYSGKERNIKSTLYRVLVGIGLLFAFGLQIMDHRPPAMMILSQAFQAMILPAVAIPIFILINNKKIMRNHVPSLGFNMGIITVIIFSLVTTYFAVADLM